MARETNALETDGEVVCGPDAPTLALRFAGLPAKRRWQKEPGHRGAQNKLLKPLRGECRVLPVNVVTNARAFYTTREAAGASGTRHSLRPCSI